MARNRNYVNKQTEEKPSIEWSPAEVETTGPHTKNGIVINTLYVKVRKAPAPESEVLEVLRKGDKVGIAGRTGRYYQVSTNANPVAYISSEFIEIEEG